MGQDLRQLFLIRHAHSHGAAAGQADGERELSEHGRASASALGRWLSAEGHVIDRLAVSGATRTLETAQLIVAEMAAPAPVDRLAELYLASPPTLGECVRHCEPTTRRLAIVAHNPGIWEFATPLAGTCGVLIEGFSPATCVLFEFGGDWSGFPGSALRLITQRAG